MVLGRSRIIVGLGIIVFSLVISSASFSSAAHPFADRSAFSTNASAKSLGSAEKSDKYIQQRRG
jgi:hypothetical protein